MAKTFFYVIYWFLFIVIVLAVIFAFFSVLQFGGLIHPEGSELRIFYENISGYWVPGIGIWLLLSFIWFELGNFVDVCNECKRLEYKKDAKFCGSCGLKLMKK